MVSIPSLWLPILLAAVLVFVVSSIIHMAFKYHANDFRQVADEDGVMEALRPFNLAPGDYVMPFAGSMDAMKSDAFKERCSKGPVAFFTVLDSGSLFDMRKSLTLWFLYSLTVGIVAAYLGGRTLEPGTDYLMVFRVTGTVAFACYSMALAQRSIWYKHHWAATLKSMFDGLIYAMITAGAFGWLWPA